MLTIKKRRSPNFGSSSYPALTKIGKTFSSYLCQYFGMLVDPQEDSSIPGGIETTPPNAYRSAACIRVRARGGSRLLQGKVGSDVMLHWNKGASKGEREKKIRVAIHTHEDSLELASLRSGGFRVPSPESPNYDPTL